MTQDILRIDILFHKELMKMHHQGFKHQLMEWGK